MKDQSNIKKKAFIFIALMGVVSLFSDMTHEGARSIMGAYLGLTGASAAAIGFVSGLGELVGYSLRLLTGILADRTKKYWTLTVWGYIFDVLAIPALALVPRGGWVFACALIILERTAKAVKKPAKDTLLSFAANRTGAGKSFAIQEFLDQLGAFLGPVMLFLVLLISKSGDEYSKYQLCFLMLGIPAVVTIVLLLIAKSRFPNPEAFEPEPTKAPEKLRLNGAFAYYIAAISLFALGFLDFPIITLHTVRQGLLSHTALPLLYSGAMAVDAFAALLFGWMYDKYGIKTLMISAALAAPFSALIFLMHTRWTLFLGVALWGIGMGAQESVLKAAVTTLVPKQNRSAGFGVFQTFFGAFWFAGSWLMGVLYDWSVTAMVAFSVGTQLLAIPFYQLAAKKWEERYEA